LLNRIVAFEGVLTALLRWCEVKPECHLIAATAARTTPSTNVTKSTPRVQLPAFRSVRRCVVSRRPGVKLCCERSTF